MTAYDATSISAANWNAKYQLYSRHIDSVLVRHAFDVKVDLATVTAADYIKLITIPAGSFIAGLVLNVHTASTVTSATVNVGDSSSATQYLSATSVTTTGATAAASTTQKVYTSADYLKVTLGTTAPTSGILSVAAIIASIPDYAAL
jgi:hypothetical protein